MKNAYILNIYFALAIFLIILNTCTKEGNQTSSSPVQLSKDFYIIRISNISEKQRLDTVIESYYYLPLETNKDCLIGKIDKIVFYNNRIYILDSQTKSLFVYEMDGRFVYKINKIGKGQGEYDNIRDFDIEQLANNIIVLCTNFRKLIFYDANNGQFIKEKKLDFRPFSFINTSQHRYLFDCRLKLEKNMGNNSLMIANSSENTSINYFPHTNYPSTERSPFSRFRDYIYYCSNYSDTVFAYRNDTLLVRYYIDFGSKKLVISSLPKELFSASGVLGTKIVPFLDQDNFSKYLQNKDIAYHITSFNESDRFIRFQFVYRGKYINALFDKTTQHVKTYLELEQTNEICYGLTTYAVYNNSFVSVIDSDILGKILTYRKKMDEAGMDALRKKVHLPDNITSEDNPMLVFLNYKNF